MHLPWLVLLPCVVSAHMRGVTSNTKFLDIQFLTEEDVDETIVLKAGFGSMSSTVYRSCSVVHGIGLLVLLNARKVDSKRLANIRSGLEITYTSLPKTDGHLAQQTLRYVWASGVLASRRVLVRVCTFTGLAPLLLEPARLVNQGQSAHAFVNLAALVAQWYLHRALSRRTRRGHIKPSGSRRNI